PLSSPLVPYTTLFRSFHDVNAGVDGVGEDLSPGGFLQETLDTALLVDDDDAELQRVGHPFQGDGDLGAAFFVEADHVGQVDVGERVTGNDDERLSPQVFLGVLDAARGAERYLLGDVVQRHSEVFPVTEIVTDEGGQELHGHDRLK